MLALVREGEGLNGRDEYLFLKKFFYHVSIGA